VILIHGGGATDFRTWGPQMEPFAARYRVIAYSQRYHYPNAAVAGYPGLTSTQAHVDDLRGLIEALHLTPVHLVTSSYGGDIALLLAAQHPELVRTLVLSEPGLSHWLRDLPGGPALDATARQAFAAARAAACAGNREQAARLFVDQVLGPGVFSHLPAAMQERLRDNALLLSALEPASGIWTPLTREDVEAILAPTLLLTGDRSPQWFLLVAEELARCMPQARRAVIAGAAHLLHGMNPADYNAAVLAYLAAHSGSCG
jgi:pimeloyl-ACP methyl ester carboxylesterase